MSIDVHTNPDQPDAGTTVIIRLPPDGKDRRALVEILLAAERQMAEDRRRSRLAGKRAIGGNPRNVHDRMRHLLTELMQQLD